MRFYFIDPPMAFSPPSIRFKPMMTGFLALLSSLGLMSSLHAQPIVDQGSYYCSPLVLTYKIKGPPLSVNTDYSSYELGQMSSPSRQNGDAHVAANTADALYQMHTQVMGLYSGNSVLSGQLAVNYTPLPNASLIGVCIQEVTLTHTRTPIIYIAKETPLGCPLNEVYQHELTHFQIETRAFAQAISPLPNWARKIPNGFKVANKADANRRIEQTLNEILQTVSDSVFHAGDTAQQALDSPAEYRRFSASCPGQWPKLRN